MASVGGSPSPPGTLRRMEYPSSPSCVRQILQIHWKQENSRTNALNDCVRVFIMTSWASRGALHYRHQNGKGLLCRNLDRESNMRPRSFDPERSPLHQAPYDYCCEYYLLYC